MEFEHNSVKYGIMMSKDNEFFVMEKHMYDKMMINDNIHRTIAGDYITAPNMKEAIEKFKESHNVV